MKIIDITRPIYPDMAVYLGSPETVFEQIGQFPKDRSVSTKITIGSHAGTHVDAPSHVIDGAGGVDSYSLERFIGVAVVFDLTGIESVITENDLRTRLKNPKSQAPNPKQIKNSNNQSSKRVEFEDSNFRIVSKFEIRNSDLDKIVLIKTKNSLMDWSTFHEDFVAIDESAARYLVSFKPKLIGIDGPSIKKFRVPDQTHQIILSQNIPIIEWLDLSKVEAGTYQFIGFPLPFKNVDGSPIRAVLIK